MNVKDKFAKVVTHLRSHSKSEGEKMGVEPGLLGSDPVCTSRCGCVPEPLKQISWKWSSLCWPGEGKDFGCSEVPEGVGHEQDPATALEKCTSQTLGTGIGLPSPDGTLNLESVCSGWEDLR